MNQDPLDTPLEDFLRARWPDVSRIDLFQVDGDKAFRNFRAGISIALDEFDDIESFLLPTMNIPFEELIKLYLEYYTFIGQMSGQIRNKEEYDAAERGCSCPTKFLLTITPERFKTSHRVMYRPDKNILIVMTNTAEIDE